MEGRRRKARVCLLKTVAGEGSVILAASRQTWTPRVSDTCSLSTVKLIVSISSLLVLHDHGHHVFPDFASIDGVWMSKYALVLLFLGVGRYLGSSRPKEEVGWSQRSSILWRVQHSSEVLDEMTFIHFIHFSLWHRGDYWNFVGGLNSRGKVLRRGLQICSTGNRWVCIFWSLWASWWWLINSFFVLWSTVWGCIQS